MVPCDPAELKDFVQFKPSSKIRFLQLAADPTRGWGLSCSMLWQQINEGLGTFFSTFFSRWRTLAV